MATIRVSAQRDIEAPAETVYGYLADMRQHERFLPKAFSDFHIESGAVGSGTVIRFKLTAGRRVRDYRMVVAEPEPGRVLRESDSRSSLVTTFTVTPGGDGSRVRIETCWAGGRGIGGFFERTFAPRVLKTIYVDELERLNVYARERRHAPAGS